MITPEDGWNDVQETLYLQSIPGLVDSIKEAQAEPEEDLIPADEAPWSNPRSKGSHSGLRRSPADI